jgi:hypothetical protein
LAGWAFVEDGETLNTFMLARRWIFGGLSSVIADSYFDSVLR